MKKISDSIYIYEFFAFFVFDFNIDIDFDIYTIDIETIIQRFVITFKRKMQLSSFRDFALRNISFNWNRSNINSIDCHIFSISICIIVSNVTFDFIEIANIENTVNTNFCEKKQFFCFVDIFVSIFIEISNINFYEKKSVFVILFRWYYCFNFCWLRC